MEQHGAADPSIMNLLENVKFRKLLSTDVGTALIKALLRRKSNGLHIIHEEEKTLELLEKNNMQNILNLLRTHTH